MTMSVCRWAAAGGAKTINVLCFLPQRRKVVCLPPNLVSVYLQDAIDKGRFRNMADNGAPQMAQILETGLEVAHGMAYLHQHDIVHGDLVRPCPVDSSLMCRILVSTACSGVH